MLYSVGDGTAFNEGIIDTLDDFKLVDHLLYFHHPLTDVPICSAMLPIGDFSDFLTTDVGCLKSFVTGEKTEKCSCQSGCLTNNYCKCRSANNECGV